MIGHVGVAEAGRLVGELNGGAWDDGPVALVTTPVNEDGGVDYK